MAKSQRQQNHLRILINHVTVIDFSLIKFTYLYSLASTDNVMKTGFSTHITLDCFPYWAILIASSEVVVTEGHFGQRQWKNYLFPNTVIQVSRKE